jgi:hypothetical protein
VVDESQRQVEAQAVAAIAVVGDTHLFYPSLLFCRCSKFGKNFPNLQMTFKRVAGKISRAYREECHE